MKVCEFLLRNTRYHSDCWCHSNVTLVECRVEFTDISNIFHFQKEKEVALNKILQLEKQLDEKHQLELDIQQLRGKLEVVKHMEGEGVDVKKRTEELNKDLQERIDAMEDLEELNQALIIKERMTNDELQDAKKALISVTNVICIHTH